MARPKSHTPVDLSEAQELTMGLIERLTCPTGKAQAFLRDSKGNGLRVRVTAGAKSFVFEGKLNRQTIRHTIGDVRTKTIKEAREEARRLQGLLDAGDDPRELDRQKQEAHAAAKAAKLAEGRRETVAGLTAWNEYTLEGREVGFSQRGKWGARHFADHLALSDAGGQPFKRKTGTTAAAIALAPLQTFGAN